MFYCLNWTSLNKSLGCDGAALPGVSASSNITGLTNAAKKGLAAALGAKMSSPASHTMPQPPAANYQWLLTKSKVSGNLSKVLTAQQKHPLYPADMYSLWRTTGTFELLSYLEPLETTDIKAKDFFFFIIIIIYFANSLRLWNSRENLKKTTQTL